MIEFRKIMYLPVFAHQSIYATPIQQKYLIYVKYASKSNAPVITIRHDNLGNNTIKAGNFVFPDFVIFVLPVTVTGRPNFPSSLMESLPVRYVFLCLLSVSYDG